MKERWAELDFENCLSKFPSHSKIPKKQFLASGKYPIISQEKDLVNGYWNKTEDLIILKKPIVVFGDHTKVLKYIDFNFVVGADGVKIFEPIDLIDSKFFMLAIKSLKLDDLGYARHYRILKQHKISFPNLAEQKAIVEKLDFAFDAIEKAKANIEKNIENAKELFQSKLNDIFSKKGEGWEEKTLGDLGKISMCKRIMKNQTTEVGDIPFYKIGTFGKKPNAFISKEIFEEFSTKYSYPKKGEILLSASGTIGRCVVFDGEPSFFQDSNIVWITHNKKIVLNEFLFQFYKICDWNPSKGATISRLYNDDLRKIIINFPSIDKQRELIPQIEKLQEQTDILQEKYKKKLANLEELKKSILEKAFKGELV